MNCEDKFLIISCMVFLKVMVIIIWLLWVEEYLIISGMSYSAIFLLVSYIQLLNLQARIYYERLITEVQLLEAKLIVEA
jgi:hypothetical protein